MLPERHPSATSQGRSLLDLRRSWPPAGPDETRGYRPLDLGGTQPLAALELDSERVVVVVGAAGRAPSALPCRRARDAWRIAGSGDGVAVALIERLATGIAASGFELRRYVTAVPHSGVEHGLGADQSNISTVVGDAAIVKWRSAIDTDGRRATRLRRHLRANGFVRTPALLASLTWTDEAGEAWPLADVDAFLAGAEDGWDHAIDRLSGDLERGSDRPAFDFAAELGTLTAELHSALLRPSDVVPRPTRTADAGETRAVHDAALVILERTLAIDAVDQHVVRARGPCLRAAIERLPTAALGLGPIHGDLHIGQVVPWRDGLDVIDLDGPPEPMAPPGDEDAPARDVAQMVCSLWNLAAAVDRRTDRAHHSRLAAWGGLAEAQYLDAYRREEASHGTPALDERLLEPFIAEQFCRELLYAQTTLPRWRYAPLQALRWRYPLEPDDDH